jgi:hypothetical protein
MVSSLYCHPLRSAAGGRHAQLPESISYFGQAQDRGDLEVELVNDLPGRSRKGGNAVPGRHYITGPSAKAARRSAMSKFAGSAPQQLLAPF